MKPDLKFGNNVKETIIRTGIVYETGGGLYQLYENSTLLASNQPAVTMLLFGYNNSDPKNFKKPCKDSIENALLLKKQRQAGHISNTFIFDIDYFCFSGGFVKRMFS